MYWQKEVCEKDKYTRYCSQVNSVRVHVGGVGSIGCECSERSPVPEKCAEQRANAQPAQVVRLSGDSEAQREQRIALRLHTRRVPPFGCTQVVPLLHVCCKRVHYKVMYSTVCTVV